jgi:hypothetical protein
MDTPFPDKKYFGIFSSRDAIINELASCTYDEEQKQSDRRNEWLAKNPDFPTEEEIVWASYEYENWSGSAYMFFQRNGKLYEYCDSHCSCNGLETEKFTFGETSWAAIGARDPNGELLGYGYHSETAVKALLALLEKNK